MANRFNGNKKSATDHLAADFRNGTATPSPDRIRSSRAPTHWLGFFMACRSDFLPSKAFPLKALPLKARFARQQSYRFGTNIP
ncbi:MAG: hypothetical protein SPI19_05000 [Peptoniphilaceae bacterium]|nr:hypothetical protein [Peptoniphilaceae bacterium]